MDQGDNIFASLLKKEGRPLAGFVLALVGDRHAAEDIFQASCMELWRIRRTFKIGTDFGAWSRTVARYQIHRYWRAKGREKVSFSSKAMNQVAEAYSDPDQADDMELKRKMLQACMEQLSNNNQNLLNERYNHGTPIRRLAKKSGRTEGGLKMVFVRLRRMLARCVESRLDGKEYSHG